MSAEERIHAPCEGTVASAHSDCHSTVAPGAVRMKLSGHLEAEDDEGNCEYKWRLTDISDVRFEHLVTQMQFRVAEGRGRCVYEIGVADDGAAVGLYDADYEESIATVRRMADALGFQLRIAYERTIYDDEEGVISPSEALPQACGAAAPSAVAENIAAMLTSSAMFRQQKQRSGRRGRKAAARGAIHQPPYRPAAGLSVGESAAARGNASVAAAIAFAQHEAGSPRRRAGGVRRRCAEIHVTRVQRSVDDLRVAFCGLGGAGKSTLVGVLTQGALDDGSGSVRSTLCNHKHEVVTGCTSSVANHVMGFDAVGRVTNYDEERLLRTPVLSPTLSSGAVSSVRARESRLAANTMCAGDTFASSAPSDSLPSLSQSALGACDEGVPTLDYALNATRTIAERSVKLVTLLDLGGKDKYSKTALFGMTSKAPGYACIVAAADHPIVDGIGLHVALCLAMRVPFCVVVTKCDAVGELELDDVQLEIDDCVRGEARRMGYAATATRTCGSYEDVLDHGFVADCVGLSLVPVFLTSCVDGTGIGYLKTFFHKLPVVATADGAQCPSRASEAAEVLIDGSFDVAEVGTVLSGLVTKGTVREGQRLLMGPDATGGFHSVAVSGIHEKGSHVTSASVGTDATFCFSSVPSCIDAARKGLVLLGIGAAAPLVAMVFECRVRSIGGVVGAGQEPIVHCRNIRQAVKIISVRALPAGNSEGGAEEDFGQAVVSGLGPHEEGIVTCRFLYHPEVLERGATLLLRWHRNVRAVGNVTRVARLPPVDGADSVADCFDAAELTSQMILPAEAIVAEASAPAGDLCMYEGLVDDLGGDAFGCGGGLFGSDTDSDSEGPTVISNAVPSQLCSQAALASEASGRERPASASGVSSEGSAMGTMGGDVARQYSNCGAVLCAHPLSPSTPRGACPHADRLAEEEADLGVSPTMQAFGTAEYVCLSDDGACDML